MTAPALAQPAAETANTRGIHVRTLRVSARQVATNTTAPAAGVAITAGFEFDVPVRFDTDALDVTLDLERLGSITSIPLVEIRT